MNKKQKWSGFTLIESLVVVTMMMVIIAAAVGSYSAANKKNRDNKRMADLDRIRMALEMYRQNDPTGQYPTDSSGQPVGLTPNFIDVWPSDPSSSRQYIYDQLTAYSYRIGAWTESGITNGTAFGDCDTVGSVQCNYVVTNP